MQKKIKRIPSNYSKIFNTSLNSFKKIIHLESKFNINEKSHSLLTITFLSNESKKLERATAGNRWVHSHNAPILISMCVPFSFFPTLLSSKKKKIPASFWQKSKTEWSTGCTFGTSIAVPLFWPVHMQPQPWHRESGHCPTLRLSDR